MSMNIDSKLNNSKIEINIDFFEHLLNCLANQKFINELL